MPGENPIDPFTPRPGRRVEPRRDLNVRLPPDRRSRIVIDGSDLVARVALRDAKGSLFTSVPAAQNETKLARPRRPERSFGIDNPCDLERDAFSLIEPSERGFDLGLKRVGNRLFYDRHIGSPFLGEHDSQSRKRSDTNNRLGSSDPIECPIDEVRQRCDIRNQVGRYSLG